MLLMKAKPIKPAAAEGVFSTMMTASRQSSKLPASQPASGTTPSADQPQTFSRQSEQKLLDSIFSDVDCTATSAQACPQLPSLSTSRSCCTDVVAVHAEQSLWRSASLGEPPHCSLEIRVQKRKAEQQVAQEKAKQDAIAQQCMAAEAMLRSCETAEPSQMLDDPAGKGSLESQSCTSSETACINLVLSPAHGSHAVVPQPAHVPAKACAATMNGLHHVKDPMKRIRLMALQQELKAARQTVADLERMILEVQGNS